MPAFLSFLLKWKVFYSCLPKAYCLL